MSPRRCESVLVGCSPAALEPGTSLYLQRPLCFAVGSPPPAEAGAELVTFEGEEIEKIKGYFQHKSNNILFFLAHILR